MNHNGFTLVELLAVMIILGIIAAISIPKIMHLDNSAKKIGIEMAVKDLNSREMGSWTNQKLEGQYKNDEELFDSIDYQIDGYEWNSLNVTGGVLQFKGEVVQLKRETSTPTQTAAWSKQEG